MPKTKIVELCKIVDFSKQAFYKQVNKSEKDQKFENEIIKIVKTIRERQPKVGTRKILRSLNQKDIYIGRDKLFKLLKENNLLVTRKKRYIRTTDSKHLFKKYPNLIKEQVPTRPNQIYVSDITYIATTEGFIYLFLITDMYSRRIVGSSISESLSSEGAVLAIQRALNDIANKKEIIHHSDRGVQYCCHDYINYLKSYDFTISMTEDNHVYENALAERVNGILKIEFIGFDPLNSKKIASKLIEESIDIYNNERLHMSLDYKTPNQVHYSINN